MPAPLSLDLRNRIVAAWENNEGTWDEIAERFAVGVASVDRLVSLIDNDGLKVVARLLAERPDLTDEELPYFCEQETKIRVSRPTIGRAVRA